MSEGTEAVFNNLRVAVQALLDLGRDSLDAAQRELVATAAAAPGATEYHLVLELRPGADIQGAAHLMKRHSDGPDVLRPIFAFRDGRIGAAVYADDDDGTPPLPRLRLN